MSELTDNEQTGATLLEILDELTERVAHAKAMPLSASVLVNQSELLDLLETARAIVPQQIVDADSVLQDISAVTDQAHSEAEAILAKAHSEAETLVAQSHAAKIVDEARQKAQHIKRGADEYSDSKLADLAEELAALQDAIDAVQDQIAAGRNVLAERGAAEEELASGRSSGHRRLKK